MLIVSLVLFFISFTVMAQELPEPISPTITYDFEIGWGSKPVTVWASIVPTSIVLASGTVSTTHNYYGILGSNKFEFETIDSTIAVPKKATVIFNVTTIPSGDLFDIFRIHVRASVVNNGTTITSAWSDPSYWVLVLNLRKLNQPVSIK